MYDYKFQVIRVIDGDTVEINIDLGFDVWYRSPARLFGINAPELHGATADAGLKSKQRLTELLASAKSPVAISQGKGKDKYGRVLITILDGTVDINKQLLSEGFAVPYMEK